MWKIFISICYLLIIVVVFCEINNNIESLNEEEKDDVIKQEIDYLSDLPLAELIKIKKSLDNLNIKSTDNLEDDNENIGGEYTDTIGSKEDITMESRLLPATSRDLVSLPLVGGVIEKILNKTSTFSLFGNKKNKNNEGGRSSVERSYEHWENKEPSKIETIFQFSITGLSFLAFGGYLLCMIVQSIKSRGTTYYHPVTTAVASLNANQNSPIKKIKVYRRSKRSTENKSIKKEQQTFGNLINKTDINKFASPSPDEMYGILKLFAEGYVKLVDN